MIKRLDKVVLRDTTVTALIAVTGMSFLFASLGLYQIVTRFDVTPRWNTLLSFVPSLLVSLLPFSVPVSVLFAGAMAFGRMRAEHELLLLAASGVPTWRPFLALVPLGIVTAAITGYVVSELGPRAYVERDALQRTVLADFIDHPPQGPRELRFPDAGVDITYASFEAGHFEGLTVVAYNDDGVLATLTAKRARVVYQRISRTILMTGCVEPRLVTFDPITGNPAGAPMMADRINELRMPFEVYRGDERPPPKALTTLDLCQRMGSETGNDRGAAADIVRRAGLAGAGLWLPLLGALLASLVSHPNRLLAVGAGVIPSALLYFPAMVACQNLTQHGDLPATVAAAIPMAIAAGACLAALWLHRQRGWA